MRLNRRALCALLMFTLLLPLAASAEVVITIVDSDGSSTVLDTSAQDAEPSGDEPAQGDSSAREAFIDGILSLALEKYEPDKTKDENWQLAREFLQQVQRGDYFQMAAKYYYGVGAHSMIFTKDYDPETDSVTWCDSNMRGATRNGERYGYVQYDAVKEIDWFVDAFCRKKYGATLYRLRDDIIWAE